MIVAPQQTAGLATTIRTRDDRLHDVHRCGVALVEAAGLYDDADPPAQPDPELTVALDDYDPAFVGRRVWISVAGSAFALAIIKGARSDGFVGIYALDREPFAVDDACDYKVVKHWTDLQD